MSEAPAAPARENLQLVMAEVSVKKFLEKELLAMSYARVR